MPVVRRGSRPMGSAGSTRCPAPRCRIRSSFAPCCLFVSFTAASTARRLLTKLHVRQQCPSLLTPKPDYQISRSLAVARMWRCHNSELNVSPNMPAGVFLRTLAPLFPRLASRRLKVQEVLIHRPQLRDSSRSVGAAARRGWPHLRLRILGPSSSYCRWQVPSAAMLPLQHRRIASLTSTKGARDNDARRVS